MSDLLLPLSPTHDTTNDDLLSIDDQRVHSHIHNHQQQQQQHEQANDEDGNENENEEDIVVDGLVGLDPGLEVDGEEGMMMGVVETEDDNDNQPRAFPTLPLPPLHPRTQLLSSTTIPGKPNPGRSSSTMMTSGVDNGEKTGPVGDDEHTNSSATTPARAGRKTRARSPLQPQSQSQSRSTSRSQAHPRSRTHLQASDHPQVPDQDHLRSLSTNLAYNSRGEKMDLSYPFGSGPGSTTGTGTGTGTNENDDSTTSTMTAAPVAGTTTQAPSITATTTASAAGDFPIFGRSFVRFVEGWLEERGMKESGQPSPLLSAYLSLPSQSIKRLTDKAYATDDLFSAVCSPVSGVEMGGAAGSGGDGGGPSGLGGMEDDLGLEGMDVDGDGGKRDGEDGDGETESDVEVLGRAERMGKEVGGMLQHLIRSTSTNYLLLLSPHTNAPTTFPILYHSPLATAFWHSLRGGPTTNLAKFVALSVPTVTTRRIAIPTGARSLDVKSRLNSLMRVQVREVSGVGDAEMKWTRPEALIGSYGVKIVGWPTGEEEVGEGEEVLDPIPQRNPSNNSVAQNKTLLGLVESGHLRIEKATQADKDAFAAQQAETAAKLAASKVSSGGGEAGDGQGEEGEGGEDGVNGSGNNGTIGPDGLLVDDEGNPLLDEMGGEVNASNTSSTPTGKPTRGKGRKPKLGPDGTPLRSSQKQPRMKSLLTLRPDGTIQTGGLEGPRKPGRPRKMTDSGGSTGGVGVSGPSNVGQAKRRRGRPRGSAEIAGGGGGVGGDMGDGGAQDGDVDAMGEGDEDDVDAAGQDVSMEDLQGLQQGHAHGQHHHQHQQHQQQHGSSNDMHAHLDLGHLNAGDEDLIDADMSLAQHAGHDGVEPGAEEEDPATAGYLEVNNMDSMPDMAEAESSAMALAHMRHSMGDEYTRYYHQGEEEDGGVGEDGDVVVGGVLPVHAQYLEGVVEDEPVHDAGGVGGHHHHHHHDQDTSLLDMYTGQHGGPQFDFPHSDESQVAVGHNIPLISPFPHNVGIGAGSGSSAGGGAQHGKGQQRRDQQQQQHVSSEQAALVEQAVNAATAAAAAMLDAGGRASGSASGSGSVGGAGTGGNNNHNKRSAEVAGFQIVDGSSGGSGSSGQDKRQRGY